MTIGGVAVPFRGSAARITLTTPGSTVTGPVPLVITTPSGSASTTFTYDPVPAPRVTGVRPARGPRRGGTIVVVSGSGFAGTKSVTLGGVRVPFLTSATRVLLVTPRSSVTGAVPLVITTYSGSASATFTYQ